MPRQYGKAIILSQYLNNELNMLKRQASIKNVTIHEKIIGEERTVYADPNLISTIMRNLISNAIKFSNENCFIQISITNKGDAVVIAIKDNGVGIEKDKQDK